MRCLVIIYIIFLSGLARVAVLICSLKLLINVYIRITLLDEMLKLTGMNVIHTAITAHTNNFTHYVILKLGFLYLISVIYVFDMCKIV